MKMKRIARLKFFGLFSVLLQVLGWVPPPFFSVPQAIADPLGTANTNQTPSGQVWNLSVPRLQVSEMDVFSFFNRIEGISVSIDPKRQGIRIIPLLPPDFDRNQKKITLSLTNVPLRVALDLASEAAGLKCSYSTGVALVGEFSIGDGKKWSSLPGSAVIPKRARLLKTSR